MSDEDYDDEVNDSFESDKETGDAKEEDPFAIMDRSNETDTSSSFGNDPYGDAEGAAFDDAFLFDPIEFEPLQEDFETDYIAAAVARLKAAKQKQEQQAGNTTASAEATEEAGSSNTADDSRYVDRLSTSSRRQQQSQDPRRSSDGGKDDGNTTSDTNVETSNETNTARLENILMSSPDEIRNNNSNETSTENDLMASFEAELSERQKATTSIETDEDGNDSSASESCAPSTTNPDENDLNSAPLQRSPQERRLNPPSQQIPSSPDSSSSAGSAPQSPGSPGYSARTKELRKRMDAATRSVPAPPSDESSTEQPRRPLDDSSSRIQSLASLSGNTPEVSRSSRADPSSRMSASHGNSSHQTSDGGDDDGVGVNGDVDVDDDDDDNYHTDSISSSEEEVSNDGGSTEAINEDSDEEEEEEFGSSESDSDSDSFNDKDNNDDDDDDDDDNNNSESTDFEEYEDSVMTETPFFTPTKDLISPGLSGSRSESLDDSESTPQESFKLQNLLAADTPSSAEARIFEDDDDDNSNDKDDDGDNDTGSDTGTGTDLQYSITSNRSGISYGAFSLDATGNSLAYSLDGTATLEHLLRTQNFDVNNDRDIDKRTTSQQHATEREENDRKGGNNDGSKSRSGSRRVENQTRQPDDGDGEMTKQPSKVGTSSAGSATISSTLNSLRDEVRESNPTFTPRQQQLITPRNQDYSSSSNTKSSSSGSKSYTERLAEMLRPFNTDHTQSSRMRNTVSSFGQTESTDIRSVTVVDPEDSTMTKSNPEESIMSRSIPEDSTMSRSIPEDSSMSRNTDMTGSSNEEHNTLNSMLADQDDSSYYSSDDARSSDQESAMVDTFMIKASPGSKDGGNNDDNDDSIDDGDVESDIGSDNDSTEQHASQDQSLTTRRRSSGSDNHEILTRSNQSHSGRSISSIMNETPESSIHSSESTTATASTAKDEGIGDITRNPLLNAASPLDHDDTSIIDKNAEEFDHSEMIPNTASASDLTREDDDVGDIARNIVLKAIGATNVDGDTSLPDENKDAEKELSQNTSKKALERIGDDGSSGVSTATSNFSSKDDDIGDIARKIMLKAIGSSEGIESRNKSDENKQVLRDSEKTMSTKIERIDNDRIHGESIATPKTSAKSDDVGDQARKLENTAFGISEEGDFSDETSNASDAPGGDIECGESTSTSSSSVTSDDVGNIARNILLKAMGASILNDDSPSFNDTSPSANDGSPSSNENDTGKKVDDDECEDSTTASSIKGDNIAAVARNIVNAAMGTPERRNLFGEESEPSAQHIDNERIDEGEDRDESAVIPAISVKSETFGEKAQNLVSTTTGTLDKETIALEDGDDGGDSNFTPFSIESDYVGEIARKLVNAAIANSNSIDSPSREHSESENRSESLDENSSYFVHTSEESSVGDEDLSTSTIEESEDIIELSSRIVQTTVDSSNKDRVKTGHFVRNTTESTHDIGVAFEPNPSDWSKVIGHIVQETSPTREDETIGEVNEMTPNVFMGNIEVALPPNMSNETELSPKSEDDTSLSSGEIIELDNLLDCHENGEETDEDRLYELDLYDRWQNGEHLNDDEIKDLLGFKERRRKVRRYQMGLKALQNRIASGEDVNGVRNLLERERAGEDLMEDDAQALADFRKEEGIRSNSSSLHPFFGGLIKPNNSQGGLESSSKTDGLDELSKRISDEPLFSEMLKVKDNITSKLESSDTDALPTNVHNLNDRRGIKEDLEISSRPDDLDEASESVLDESLFPETSNAKDSSISKLESSDANVLHTDGQHLNDPRSNEEGLQMSPTKTSSRVSTASTVGGKEDGHYPLEGVAGNEDMLEPQLGEKAANYEDQDDYSNLSSWELDELDDLVERQEHGFDVPANRLRNLELFDKWQNDEALDEDELKVVDRFKKNRKRERGYGRELINLIESKERGEEIDSDRLAALELFARHHTGEKLTKDELETLKEFERGENESVDHDASKENAIDDKESDDHGNAEKLTGGRSFNESGFDSHDEGSTKDYGSELINLIESKEKGEKIDYYRLADTGEKLTEGEPETSKELERSENEPVDHEKAIDDKESDDHGSAEKLTGDKSCTDSSFDSRDEGSANLINPKRSSEISRQELSDTNAPALDEKPNLLSHSLTGSSHAEEKHRIEEIDIIDFNDSILTGQDKNDSISSRSRGEKDRANHQDDASSHYGSCNSRKNSDNSHNDSKSSSDDRRANDQSLPANDLRSRSDDTQTRSLILSPPGNDKSSSNSCQSQEESAHSSASEIDGNASAEDSNRENIDALTRRDAKVTLSSNPFIIADKVASSSLHDESCSSRDPVLSVGEMDELQELLDREENGESVDEDRIYELDLLIRCQVGESLKDDELVDFFKFQAKRNKQRESDQISQEKPLYRGLVEKDHDTLPPRELGGTKDFGNRQEWAPPEASFFRRKSLKSPFEQNPLHLRDSKNFSNARYPTPIPKPEVKSSTTDRTVPPFGYSSRNEPQQEAEKERGSNIPLVENRRLAEIPKRNKVYEEKLLGEEIQSIKELERTNVNTERKRLEENKRVLDEEENLAKLAEQKKLEEEARMAEEIELIKGLELKKIQEEQRRLEEEARLIEERLKMETEQRRMRIENERKQLAKEARLAEEKILTKQKMRKKLEKEAQVAEENRISKENERKKLEIEEQNLRDINYSAEIERATEEVKRGAIEVEATKEIFSAILGEEEAPSFEDTSNSSASYDISLSIESQLSIWEMDEINELLDREENGESVDEDRIYELDLFSRYQVGQKLDQEEITDLDEFRKRRRKHRLDTKRQTIQVDGDRLQRRSPLYDHDVINGNSSRLSEASQKSEMDGHVIGKHIDLETTNQPMDVVKDESSLTSNELIDSFSEKPSSASNFQARNMSEGTGDDASLGLGNVFDGLSKVDIQEEHILDTAIEARKDGDAKDLNNDPNAKSDEDLAYVNQPAKSPSRNETEDTYSFFLDNSSRSDSRSFSMSIVSGTNGKPEAVEAANLKSRPPSPSSLPSQRKREKQRSEQNKKRHDSFSASSSSVRSQKGDQDKSQRATPLDGKKGHRRIESGSRSLSSSNQSGYSGNDSKSFNSSKKEVKSTEREIVMPKKLEKKTKKEDEYGSPLSTPRSKRRDNKRLSKGVSESIPPRPTSSKDSRNKKHKRYGNAGRGSSENDSKESNIDDRVSISMQSISSRSSIDKQDYNSLQSSGRDSSQNDQPQSKNKKPSQTMGTRSMSNRKNESTKAQKYIPRAFTPKGKRSETQDKLQTVESVIPSKAMEKAFHTLQAWDTLYEGPSQNSGKATNEVSGLEDREKGNSSWAPAFDWNPFAHIKQRSLEHGLHDQSQNTKPDPPIVNVRPPQEAEKPQEVSQIEESIYVNRMIDDSSVVSNWGPPSLLKTERKQKYSYVQRKYHFEMHSELSSYPKEYDQEPPHRKETIHPHHHVGRIPFIVRSEKPIDESPKGDSRVKSDVEDFKGFDPDLLLSSWGLPVLEKENPMRSKDMEIIPRNVPTRTVKIESTQGIPGVNQLHSASASSIASHAASLTKDRQIQAQDGNDDSDGYSQEFIDVEESIGGSSDVTSDFDLEQGISKLQVPLKMSQNVSEDGSNSRSSSNNNNNSSSSSSSSSSVEIIVPLGQSSIDQSTDTPQDDSQIGKSGTRKRRRRPILHFVILCLILLALIAGGLTALFVFLKRRNKDESTPSTPPLSPLPVPSQIPVSQTPPPSLSPIFVEPNTKPPNDDSGDDNIIIDDNSIFNLIVANAPDGGASLKDPSSPQSAALSWLYDPINKEYSDSRLLQRYALATLYYATNLNNDSWKITSLWLTDTNECDWHNTSESPDVCTTTTIMTSDGSIIENIVYRNLDLRENGLKGTIPDEISLLTSLKTIRLSKNELTGSIPSHVTTLNRLEYLDLSSNQLVEDGAINTGNRIQFENDDERNVHVDAVTTMSADEDTSINIFTRRTVNEATTATTMTKMNGETSSSSFLSEMQNMQSLIHLDIFENSFQTTLPSDIWGEGSSLSSTLQVLNLGSNQFYGTLPTEIGFLTKLTGLSVFGNDLSGQLPASISQMTLLELLYIDSNKFESIRNEPGVPQAICESLRPEPLREFWADCEQISCYCCTVCCSEDLGCITA
jgi:hypothetical protein